MSGYAFFTLDGDGTYVPTRYSRSAWSETMLNGPAVVAAAALLVAVPGPLDTRAAVALLAGPGVGVALHVVGLLRVAGTPRTEGTTAP